MRKILFTLSLMTFLIFTYFSYIVAKELWQQFDFDTMVRIQDHIPRSNDLILSYFTLLGDVEITLIFCVLMSFLALLRKHFWAFLGWLLIVPASMAEIFGKLVLFHPAPPVFFHRTILPENLPQFYVHTNFSYPSGHMTRTIFIITVILFLVLFSKQNYILKLIQLSSLIFLAFMLALTRIYLGEHWLSDVLGGILLGSSMGLFASVLILPKRLR